MTQGITRRGGQLLRPMGAWSGAVHDYLLHLETATFSGAPRFLGTEGEREVLTYIDGEVPADPQWQPGRGHRLPPYARSEAALVAAARLVRQLHDAARGYRPRDVEFRFDPRPLRTGEIVSHGDLGPWNTVYRHGVPVAFIDWDAAGPIVPVVELAAAAWEFVPLAPPEQLHEAGFDPVPDVAARLRIFVDAYGLSDRRAILPALQRCRLLAAERIKYAPVSAAEAADALEHHARELRWLHSLAPRLDGALIGLARA
ncbi:Phosphotransferase enzyme family protein [Micromonospora siamensis]|uniref:Phosphotransferase enzyme family protein n=2 Tax=Micromonospora siamensis TaxID=299152 RepID=A0A1C5IDT8_9ACTN|nr:Phosphotransferase enzyme family protein [Micromonospora siamensis]